MIEFTKEELIEIHDYCNWEPPAIGMSKFRENIWLKIQSMIDSYCAHNWLTFLNDSNRESFIEKCLRCHKLRFTNENHKNNM